jgi:regulatory protein
VRRNLRGKDVDGVVIDAVIGRLTHAGLLDDREFARYWIDNRARFNPRGLRGLRHELRQKGISRDIIDDVLTAFDVDAAAEKVVEAGARRLSGEEPRDFRRKLQAYMARRGFSYGVIKPLVQEKLEQRRREEERAREDNE